MGYGSTIVIRLATRIPMSGCFRRSRIRIRQTEWRLLPMTLLLIGITNQGFAQIQDDIEETQPTPMAARMVFMANEQHVVSNLYRTVFQGLDTIEKVRLRFDMFNSAAMRALDEKLEVRDDQKQKLELALKGDQQRFLKKVDEFSEVLASVAKDQNKYQELYSQNAGKLMNEYRNMASIEGGIFFKKTLDKVLDRDQLEVYQKYRHADKQATEYRYLKMGMQSLCETLGLNSKQRKQVWALIVEETRSPPNSTTLLNARGILNQFLQIPEARLKPVLSPFQWKRVSQYFKTFGQRVVPQAQQKNANGTASSAVVPEEVAWDVPADMDEADRLFEPRPEVKKVQVQEKTEKTK